MQDPHILVVNRLEANLPPFSTREQYNIRDKRVDVASKVEALLHTIKRASPVGIYHRNCVM